MSKGYKKIVSIFFLLLLINLVLATEETISLYPTTVSELNARVTLFGKGSVSGLNEGEEATFQTITFKETPLQTINIIKKELVLDGTPFYPKTVIDKFDNKYFVYTLTKNGDFEFEITADINVVSFVPKILDSNIVPPNEIFLQYTKPTEKIESESTEIINLVNNKFVSNDFVETLNNTILWVNDYVEYARDEEFNMYYLQQKTAVETLLNKKGVCDEFSNLAAAILRAKKIPTRVIIGITFDGRNWGNHAWIEVYNEKQNQWFSSDPTFRESGFVDATHIMLGSFDDISNSIATAHYPPTANLVFDTQSQLPEVKINSVKYFDLTTISTTKQNLVTNNWNKINLVITNNTNQKITTPLIITNSYNELLIKEKKQSLNLEPHEEKEVWFEVYPKIDLAPNQIAQGFLTINSLSAPKIIPIEIIRETRKLIGEELIIENIIPIISENNLLLQTKIKNHFVEDKTIHYQIITKNKTSEHTKLIPKLSTVIIEEKIINFDSNKLEFKIIIDEKEYSQTILINQKNLVIQKPIEHQDIVEQKIDSNNNEEPIIALNPLIILTIILIIIGLLFATIIWFNKKYI